MTHVAYRRLALGVAFALAGCSGASSASGPNALTGSSVAVAPAVSGGLVEQVASRVPITGATSVDVAAVRPVYRVAPTAAFTASAKAKAWQTLGTMAGAIIHDIAFPTATVGYAAGEAGEVWKTIDGGKTWSLIMNLSYPYYWYGVSAIDANNVVISGFIDQNVNSGGAQQGVIRWTHNGGKSWSRNIVLTGTASSDKGWLNRVRFLNEQQGMVLSQGPGPLTAFYTASGGEKVSDWKGGLGQGGWWGAEFMLSATHARASGPDNCTSTTEGAVWQCGPSVDPVFDGAVFFKNPKTGWVGGGEIAPQVSGWVHVTTDGGKTWSGRTLNAPFPIREIYFLTPKIGWAAGGNFYSGIGGIYFSQDGGQTWTVDLNSQGHEMGSCTALNVAGGSRIWCVGFGNNGGYNSIVYSRLYSGAN
jgi:photosystem II stability/assembly factor-like uncharacterized protein